MPISYEKRLKGHEEALIQTVLLHGKFEAMRIFGLRDYVAFSRWWKKRKMKRGAKSEEVEKAKGWPIFTELVYEVKKGKKWPRFTELAYIAGLFDGEVALQIKRTGNSYALGLSYMKINYDILEFLSNIFGGTVRPVKRQPNQRFERWEWHITSANAYIALRKLYPFLRIKKEAAAICIGFFEHYWRPPSSKPVSEERRIIGAQCKSLLQEYQSKPGSNKESSSVRRLKQHRSIATTPTEHVQVLTTLEPYRLPDFALPELELAYIAGLLDVESSFLIYKLSNSSSYLLEVAYRKTDYNTLEYLANIFGGRVRPAPRSLRNKQDVWLWKLASEKAYRLLKLIHPFLRIKRKAAEICMKFFELYWRPHYTIPVSEERQAIGAKYADLLRQYHTKSWPHRRLRG